MIILFVMIQIQCQYAENFTCSQSDAEVKHPDKSLCQCSGDWVAMLSFLKKGLGLHNGQTCHPVTDCLSAGRLYKTKLITQQGEHPGYRSKTNACFQKQRQGKKYCDSLGAELRDCLAVPGALFFLHPGYFL